MNQTRQSFMHSQQGAQRFGQPGTDWVRMLMLILTQSKLNEVPEISAVAEKIAVKNDQAAAKKWVMRLAALYYRQQLNPDYFRSFDKDLGGEITLGRNADGKPFGLNREELGSHTFISGQSGSGKSNLLKFMFLQAREKGIHAVHFDRKGDLEHAAREGIDSIDWLHMKLNPLCPPDCKVNICEYRNDFVKAFSELMQFQQRGTSVFLLGVDELYKDFRIYENWLRWNWQAMRFPSLPDLLDVFKSDDFRKKVRGQGAESLLSIIDKLESLIIQLEPIVSCQRGFDIEKLYREKRVINYNLDGISVEYQNFLIVIEILQYAHFFKAHGPRNQLNTLFVFDEAKGLFGKANQNTFIIKDLVSKIRELGIGLVCADQIPSEISQFFFSNIATLVMFRHSDGNDLQRLRYSSGASVEQIMDNYTLKPGQAVVRCSKSKDLHKITVPFTPVEKFISREELDKLMAPRLAELNKDVIPYVKAEADCKDIEERKKGTTDGEQKRFLQHLATNFDKPSSAIYQELGLSNSEGFRLKEKLRQKKFISQVTTNLGRDGKKAVFLVPNRMVFEELGIELGSGRGGVLHKHFQAGLKARAEQFGFIARIDESTDGTPEAADVSLEKDRIRIAVEICVTSKPSTEVLNIEKNFRLGFDGVILTFVNRQVLEKTKDLASARYPQDLLQKVKFCLVNEFSTIFGES